MPDRQDHDLLSVVMMESNIGSMSEFNYPLAQLRRQLFDGMGRVAVDDQEVVPGSERLMGGW